MQLGITSNYVLSILFDLAHMQSEQIYALVQTILHPKDNTSRIEAENALMELYLHQPQQIIMTYLDILDMEPYTYSNHPTTGLSFANFTKFITLQLNNCLSKQPRPPYRSLWPKLTQTAQQTVKQRLCSMLVDKQNNKEVKQLCEVIGNLASHIIVTDDSSWPQLSELIIPLAGSEQATGMYCVLFILQQFYQHQLNNYKQIIPHLPQLFQLGFQSSNIDINYRTLRCIAAYLLVLDHNRHRQFGGVIPMMYKTVLDMLMGNNTKGLDVLVECLEYQPRFFKQQFPSLLQLCQHINDSNLDYKIKQCTTTALLQYSYICPSLFRTNPPAVNLLVDMIVMRMMVLSETITNQWMVPEEGFNSERCDQPQQDIIHANLYLLNKLVRTVGQNSVLPRVKLNIDELLATNKWTYHYAAVAMLSQLGEFIADIDDIKPYLTIIFSLLKHQNPKLRYIAVHAIGMIAQQRKKQIKSRYSQLFIGSICQLLLQQQCPRVVSHIWNALSNILTDFPYIYFQPYQQQLMAAMLDSLNNGISMVKQCALYALAQVVAVKYLSDQPYDNKISKCLPTVIQLISQYFYSGEYLKPCYNHLRGFALETLSSIALIIGKEGFMPYLQPMTSTLLKVQSQQYNDLVPPYGYIITAWTRLGCTFGSQLSQYVHSGMPVIFSFILSTVTAHSQQQMEEQLDSEQHNIVKQINQKKIDITRQIQFGIKMINCMMSNIPAFAQCYYEEISAVYVALVSHSPDQDIKREVYESLSTFVDKLLQDVKKVDTATHLIELIVTSINQQEQSALMGCKLKAIACIMNQFTIKILPPSLLNKLTSVLHSSLLRSYSQIMQIMRRSVDFDRDELQQAEGEIVLQQNKLQAMSDVFTEILQLYGIEVLQFAITILKQFVLEVFQEGQRQTIVKVGVYLIDDMVQYIGYDYLQQYWSWIQNALEKYVVYNQCAIRQAASYGLGIFMQRCPKQVINQTNANQWLQLLHRAFLIPRKLTDSKAKYYNCSDNIIAALGKLINSCIHIGIPQQSIKFWLGNLPLVWDKKQNYQMANIVIELIQKSTHIMCGYSKERILQLLRVIAASEGQFTRLEKIKLKRAMEIVVDSANFVENNAELMGQLIQTTRATLQYLYNLQPPSNH